MEELSYLLLDQGTELPARAEACAAFEEESEVPAAHVVGAHWAPPPPGAVSPPPWLGDYGFFFGLTDSASRCATQLRSDFSRKQLAKMALNGEVKLLAQSDPGWAARVVATDVRNNGTGRISERRHCSPTPSFQNSAASTSVALGPAGSTILVKKGKDPSDAIVSTQQLEAAVNELMQEDDAVKKAEQKEYDVWYRAPPRHRCLGCILLRVPTCRCRCGQGTTTAAAPRRRCWRTTRSSWRRTTTGRRTGGSR